MYFDKSGNQSIVFLIPFMFDHIKNMGDDGVCFLCKDGGTLVLCDHKKCKLAYHAECLGRELKFFTSGQWHCGRHFCTSCLKPSSNYCATCPTSFCTNCLNISVSGFLPLTYTSEAPQAELHTGEYGLCKACLRIVRMIELEHTADEHGKMIDFNDSTTMEFLFKESWTFMKHKYGFKPPHFFGDSHVLKLVADPHPTVMNSLQKEVTTVDELQWFSRSQLLEILDDPFKFTAAVVGAFVRVRVMNKEGTSHHRLVQITGTVLQSDYYEVGKKKTNILIEVLNVNRRERIKINLVSDRLSTEECVAKAKGDVWHSKGGRKESVINETHNSDPNALERMKQKSTINGIHGSSIKGSIGKEFVSARSKQGKRERIANLCCGQQEIHGNYEKDLQTFKNKKARMTNSIGLHDTDPGASEWYYRDMKDEQHGPFSMKQLRNWSKRGIFPENFRIWRCAGSPILLTEALVLWPS